MRRLLIVTVSGALLLSAGCVNRYQARMDRTIEEIKYERELDKNLEKAAPEGKLKELDIFVRPPKGLQPAKETLLPGVQPGLFDVDRTYYEGQKSFLHVLARKKMPKKPATKGAPAEPPVARGDFLSDVIKTLREGLGADEEGLSPEKFKDDPHKANKFRRAIFTASNNKKVEVFIAKTDPFDVALIYVFDPADEKALNPKINYSLEAFALGDKAKNKYSGTTEAEAEAATANAPTATF